MPAHKRNQIPRRDRTLLLCPECLELKLVRIAYNTTGVDVAKLECGHRRTAFLPDLSERHAAEGTA
jgi:hypothetical protein